jgi:hypothetical protein
MAANDKQIDGDHYRTGAIQHWDWAENMRYLEGCATKYIARHREKNGSADLEKAMHFIEKIVERDYGGTLDWHMECSALPLDE